MMTQQTEQKVVRVRHYGSGWGWSSRDRSYRECVLSIFLGKPVYHVRTELERLGVYTAERVSAIWDFDFHQTGTDAQLEVVKELTEALGMRLEVVDGVSQDLEQTLREPPQ
jgi:hypothetical protein